MHTRYLQRLLRCFLLQRQHNIFTAIMPQCCCVSQGTIDKVGSSLKWHMDTSDTSLLKQPFESSRVVHNVRNASLLLNYTSWQVKYCLVCFRPCVASGVGVGVVFCASFLIVQRTVCRPGWARQGREQRLGKETKYEASREVNKQRRVCGVGVLGGRKWKGKKCIRRYQVNQIPAAFACETL